MWFNANKMVDQVALLKKQLGNLPPDQFKARMQEEFEAGWQIIEDCVSKFQIGKNILKEGGCRFDTLSLGNWMEVATFADIPFVPAHLVGFTDPIKMLRDENTPLFNAFFEEHDPSKYMVRRQCGFEDFS